MKTMLHVMLILVACISVQAADSDKQTANLEEIASLEARLKQLHSQTLVGSEVHHSVQSNSLVDKDEKLADLRMKLALTEKELRKLGKAKSSTGIVASLNPNPMPYAFNLSQTSKRPLIIPGLDTDIEQVSEDMAIMTKILAKQLQEQGLASWSWPNTHNIETIAIDGYGVMFILGVNFPLLDQADSTSITPDDNADTVWSETRRELTASQGYGYGTPLHESAPSYDAGKVEWLKETLCKSLKHAANIRSIQGSQWVVMVVNSEQNHDAMKFFSSKGNISRGNNGSGQNATMVIKAQKANIDRFASQQIDLKDFQDGLQVKTYSQP